jgi:hypothetical protein
VDVSKRTMLERGSNMQVTFGDDTLYILKNEAVIMVSIVSHMAMQ